MLFHSFIGSLTLGLLYHVVLVASQAALNAITQAPTFVQSAAPELAGSGTSSQPCGGCYLVADVAGLVWYSEIFLNTAATELVSVGVGNGTRATRTSVLQNEGAFTFNPAATAAGSNALTQVAFDPTVSISGAILCESLFHCHTNACKLTTNRQSPTAYNVFTAYSVTSAYLSNGLCVTTSGSKIELTSAYSEILPTASGKVYLDANGQQDFIDHLGFHSCSGGGENIVPTALIQVMNTTATQVTTFSGILAAQSASLTIAPVCLSANSFQPLQQLTGILLCHSSRHRRHRLDRQGTPQVTFQVTSRVA